MTVLDDSDWSHKAWMSKRDADLFERLLLDATTGGPSRILEWGAGKSTSYFTQLLRSEGRSFRWTSLEYNLRFFEDDVAPGLDVLPAPRVIYADNSGAKWPEDASMVDESIQAVDFLVFDYGKLMPMVPEGVEDRKVNMDAYVAAPGKLEGGFDVILVDGRKRRRCLLEAARLIKPGGLVVLHDAQRTYYHCAYEAFDYSQPCADILWVGSQGEGAGWIRERLESEGALK